MLASHGRRKSIAHVYRLVAGSFMDVVRVLEARLIPVEKLNTKSR